MSNGTKILLFEIDAINVVRYYLDVMDWDSYELTILIENTSESKILESLLVSKGLTYKVVVAQKLNEADLRKLLRSQNVLMINGQRIPDTYLTLLSHQENVPVLYLQHGMYIPFMKRSIGFFFPKLFKSVRYLMMAISTARIQGGIGLLNEFTNAFLIGNRNHRNYHKYGDSYLPDYSLVFSEYWADWHKNHYFHPDYDNFTIIGNPDVDRFPVLKVPDNSCCYCYQTLVEDGRIDRDTIFTIITRLKELAQMQEWDFSIKSHPRMSSDMKLWVLDQGITMIDNEIPLTAVTFGHYSSLLPLWSFHGSVTVIIELPGHDIDESIRNCVDYIVPLPDVDKMVLSELEKKVSQDNINYYYNYTSVFKMKLNDVLKSAVNMQSDSVHAQKLSNMGELA